MIDQIVNPPAVVRSVDENEEKDYMFWHNLGIAADKEKNLSNLKHAESLYHMSRDKNYEKMNKTSFGEYVYSYFGKSKSWGEKLASVYAKFYVELKQDPKELEEVGFGKLAKLVSMVNSENVSETLENAKTKTQKEIDKDIKESKGLAENETEVDEQTSRISFSAPKSFIELFNDTLNSAKKDYAEEQGKSEKDILDFQAIQLIFSSFILNSSLSGGLEDTLRETFDRVESVYNIKITYEKNDE